MCTSKRLALGVGEKGSYALNSLLCIYLCCLTRRNKHVCIFRHESTEDMCFTLTSLLVLLFNPCAWAAATCLFLFCAAQSCLSSPAFSLSLLGRLLGNGRTTTGTNFPVRHKNTAGPALLLPKGQVGSPFRNPPPQQGGLVQ